MFKAKAEAEAQKYQAQGLKAGEDFVGCKSCTAKTSHSSSLSHVKWELRG